MLISAFRRLKIEGRNQIRLVYDQTPDFFERQFLQLFSKDIFLSNGEFDPGSGRTLEVCLIHASRTRFDRACSIDESGARVSNAWVTCLEVWDNIGKPMLIPTNFYYCMVI